jgi:hypothetical protein
VLWVAEPPRDPSSLAAGELRAVLLGLALGQQYPVGQVGQLGRRGLAAGSSLGHQIQASALEPRIAVGVLSQQPGRVRAVLADHLPAGPADLGHGLCQPSEIAGITDATVSHSGSGMPRAA